MNILLYFCYFVCFALADYSNAFGAFDSYDFNKNTEPLRLVRVSPLGDDIPPGREIVFIFNRPVVPIGQMERSASEIPISTEPHLNCEWRWLNTSSLACQLGERDRMSLSTRYKITVHPGIRNEDGVTMKQEAVYSFITQRPRVEHFGVKTWNAPGSPIISISFNQLVSRQSVLEHIYLTTGEGKRHNLIAEEGEGYRDMWYLRPQKDLPLDERVNLRVEPGIASSKGPELGIENRIIDDFYTFPEFRFIGAECRDSHGNMIPLDASGSKRCNPKGWIEIIFSAPPDDESLKGRLRLTTSTAGHLGINMLDYIHRYQELSFSHKKGNEYRTRLSAPFKPFERNLLIGNAKDIKDVFGRPLTEDIKLEFFTDHLHPIYTLPDPFFVLEKGENTDASFLLRNLDEIVFDYDAVSAKGKAHNKKTLKIDKPKDVSYEIPLGARDMIQAPSGAVSGSISTPVYQWFFGQVTPYNVHAKAGRDNILVWVTELATGLPAAGVQVDLYKDSFASFSERPEVLSSGISDSNGVVILKGIKNIPPDFESPASENQAERWNQYLFVRCKKGNDLALLPLAEPFLIERHRRDFVDARYKRGQDIERPPFAWGTTAQGVYKAGDTVQYKFYVRDYGDKGFIQAPDGNYALKIFDPYGKAIYESDNISLSEFGSFGGEFILPNTANLGWYSFELSANSKYKRWTPMKFLVADFAPAPFSVIPRFGKDLHKAGEPIEVTASAMLHSGGPYVNGQGRVTATLNYRGFFPNSFADRGFWFDSKSGDLNLYQKNITLDGKGEMSARFNIDDPSIQYGKVVVESAVMDERGKYVAATAAAIYAGRDRFVGIRQTQLAPKTAEPVKFEVIVLDERERSAAGTSVDVKIERERAMKEMKGDDDRQWIDVGKCKLTSGMEPGICKFIPKESGEYRVTASIIDTKGLPQQSSIRQTVLGNIDRSQSQSPLEIVPERNSYKIGDTARYIVRNPYPGAAALVTIERNGTAKEWVQTFQTDTVIEFPVTSDLYPGYYLSVLSVSPRTDKKRRGGNENADKPAFKKARVRTYVEDDRTISVEVKPQKDTYRPRENITLDLRASIPSIGSDKNRPPMELAVIVLDEAVFELLKEGRDYFDPYKGFYSHKVEPVEVTDLSLLPRLIGSQSFGEAGEDVFIDRRGSRIKASRGLSESMATAIDNRSAQPPNVVIRSIFKSACYWNPSIKTDAEGNASVSFPAPDNLTSWRVVVLAVTDADYMGMGEATFKVNNPFEIRPVLPNRVTEGDRFQAGFSVMNRTDAVRRITATVVAKGAIEAQNGDIVSLSEELVVEPFSRKIVWLPLKAKGKGKIILTAQARDGEDVDALQSSVPVRLRTSLETAASYGTTVHEKVVETISFPKGIRTDVGKVGILVSPSIIGNLDKAFRFMHDYSYGCWEQKLSKAVMAAQYLRLKQYLPEGFNWEDGRELVEKTLADAGEYQSPNGGMRYYSSKDSHDDPYLSAYTALAFNWLRQYGYAIPGEVENRLHGYLFGKLRDDAWADTYSKSMVATVKAVALVALAPHEMLDIESIKKLLPLLPEMSLFGKAHILKALLYMPGTPPEMQEDVVNSILSHADYTGGKIIFSETLDHRYKQILTSSLRDNGAVLSALLEYAETSERGAKSLGDIPVRLVRNIMEAGKSMAGGNADRWGNTQENIFCLNALLEFSRIYEKDKPNMILKAFLNNKAIGETAFKGYMEEAVEFTGPIKGKYPGRKAKLTLLRKGEGRVYYSARLSFAPSQLKAQPINSGIEVHREYRVEQDGKWILPDKEMSLKTGELVRIDIYLSLPAARYFLVADDPVPGGLEPVNQDLATTSSIDARKSDLNGGERYLMGQRYLSLGYRHKEFRNDAVRFYSEYLPAGNYYISYIAQAISPGEFTVMPLHVEEMYSPDVFGKGSPAQLNIERSN